MLTTEFDDGFKAFFDEVSQNDHYDTEYIKKAYELAKKAHKNQKRRSGEPYIMHPVAVAEILLKLGMDNECIVAALLHDVVEDTEYDIDYIKENFGENVALLVDGVTKLGKIPLSTREEVQAENIRKMFIAMNKDVRVIIIKLADRLHNMRTLQYMPDYKQREKSLETLEIYAPIAHRLGIRAIKDELEDLAIRYLDPIAYKEIENSLSMKKEEGEQFLGNIKKELSERISPIIKNSISSRVKSVHGIFRKVYIKGKSFEEIYDIYAVRIIVDTMIDCYNVLGIVHDMYKPIPGRFKDYISTPKPNMYQSLHTTVLSKEGIPFEIQIRTWEMHRTAEYGIAAHWKYKLGKGGKDNLDAKLSWIHRMIETGESTDTAEDLVATIKGDLSIEEVYVFTPRGDIKSLPNGSTVIDFAYAIHSAVGNKMVGAKVDGRIVPLDYKIKTGERIEEKEPEQPVSIHMEKTKKPVPSSNGIIVEGIDNCLIKIAKCCSPLPGEDIVGFITRGHGLSVHRRNCVNVPQDLQHCAEPERWIHAYWDSSVKVESQSTIDVFAIDRDGIVLDITSTLMNMHVKIYSINARQINDGNCLTTLTVSVNSKEHLENIVKIIKKIDGVYHIERIGV